MKIEYSQPVILEQAQVTCAEGDPFDDEIIEIMKREGFDYRTTIYKSKLDGSAETILLFKRETFYEKE